ncbi:MAG: hypothetical protein WBA46_12965 [Thermomicrobiales bacterium]
MIQSQGESGSSLIKWGAVGCGGMIGLVVALIVAGWAWTTFGSQPEPISMHGSVILSTRAEFVLTGEKTYTGNDRCVGAGSRSILKGDQYVKVQPSRGKTASILLEEGFVNGDGKCEMWFIGEVPHADTYRITVPTFDTMTFQTSMIDALGRTGSPYLAPSIVSEGVQ